jgi:glycogen(starch) synthase
MRILLCSHAFAPNIGGIETVGSILADQWTGLGAGVTVVTQTPGGRVSPAYDVVRRASAGQVYRLARMNDIVFQNNISLQTLIPILPARKPIVITHHGMVNRADGSRGWQEHLKLALLPFCRNIAISKAVADALPVKSTLIYDPFEAGEFACSEKKEKSRDIVFLGRLVSDKGCDLVLQALAILKAEGIRPTLTVIGDGPEMTTLKRITAETGLSDTAVQNSLADSGWALI